MLTSFFGKSTPLNYFLLSTVIIVSYLLKLFFLPNFNVGTYNIITHLVLILLMIFVVLLLDFIIRKNHVTDNNTFAIFIFVLFIVLTPSVYLDIKTLLSNTFLLLATRRVLSLNTEKNIEKKIFDAAMYITIASFLYFWSFLYFIVLYVGIVRKTQSKARFYLIPLSSIIAIFILFITYQLVVYNNLSWFYTWPSIQNFNFESYNNLSLIVPALLLFALLLWTGSVRFFQINSLSKKAKPAASSIALIGFVLIAITVFGSHNNGSELIFIMMPAAIGTANYVEQQPTKERTVFNEILLWFILIIAVLIHII